MRRDIYGFSRHFSVLAAIALSRHCRSSADDATLLDSARLGYRTSRNDVGRKSMTMLMNVD